MNAPPLTPTPRRSRVSVDLAKVEARLAGRPPGPRPAGDRGVKVWWRCPFRGPHPDWNSFEVTPSAGTFSCGACKRGGNRHDLVRELSKLPPAAVARWLESSE